MAAEIAADVKAGRMEGPFAAPACWGKATVPLPGFVHTANLLPGPEHHFPCCVAFAVHQGGVDGRAKIRRAEDWRQSGANSTVGVPDTPAYHDIEAFAKLAAVIRRRVGGPLSTWGLDHEAAYRQLPAADPQKTYVVLQTPSGPTLWRHNVRPCGRIAGLLTF